MCCVPCYGLHVVYRAWQVPFALVYFATHCASFWQAALHPTPAVCGRARARALEVLGQHEDFDRGMYAGPIGWVAGGAAEFAVAIRSALQTAVVGDAAAAATHAQLSLFAGVGIVRGSDAAQEWAELDLKARCWVPTRGWIGCYVSHFCSHSTCIASHIHAHDMLSICAALYAIYT